MLKPKLVLHSFLQLVNILLYGYTTFHCIEMLVGSGAQTGTMWLILAKGMWMVVKYVTSGLTFFKNLMCFPHTLFPFHQWNLDNDEALGSMQPQDGISLGPWITLWRRITFLSVIWLRNKICTVLDTKMYRRSIYHSSLVYFKYYKDYYSKVPKHVITINDHCWCKF